MKPKTYAILSVAVENGIMYGHQRAYKHTDSPTKEQIEASIYDAIMSEVSEYFTFEETS